MGIYSIRVQYDRSLLVGKCVNGLEQRTTVAPANFIGYRISSFKFPLGLIVSVSFSAQYCQSHLWYRTGWDNECKAPPPLFQYAPSLFRGEKLLSPLQSFKLPLPSSSAFFQMTNSYLIIIERRSRYVTLPWQQHFWMKTNRKFT